MGGGKAIVCVLLKASAVGVQAWRRRGTAGVVDKERGHGWRGAPAWGSRRHGAVLRRGVVLRRGGCTGVGIEEEERWAGNGGAGRSGRVRGERWCPSTWGGAPMAQGEGLALG